MQQSPLYTNQRLSIYTLHRCLNVLDDIPIINEDQKKGVDIVQFALKQPTMTIAQNAGAGKFVV